LRSELEPIALEPASLEPREFIVEMPALSAAFRPGRLALTVAGCAAFVLILLLRSSDPEAKLAAVGAIGVFGGGALLVMLSATFWAFTRPTRTLRVDTGGLTWTVRNRLSGRHSTTLPWSNVDSLSIMDSNDLPSVRSLRASHPLLVRTLPIVRTRFVAVVPCRIDDISTANLSWLGRVLSRPVTRASGGMLSAGPVTGATPEELLSLLGAYRSHAMPPT
jgi:hypothetical protein